MKKVMHGKKTWKHCLIAAGLSVLLLLGSACGSSKDQGDEGSKPAGTQSQQEENRKEQASTEILTDQTVGESAVVEQGVTLPDGFDNMPYVMEALMVQDYAKNMPYYRPDLSEEYADSFYYSMAVLASLIEQKTAFGDGVVSGKYYYLSEETVDKYAAALYDTYGQGNMEFPTLDENDVYAMYDEDIDSYAFIIGDVGDMVVHITECSQQGDEILIKAALYGGQKSLKEYQFLLRPTSFIAEQNEFAYSVVDMAAEGEEEGISFSQESTESESTSQDQEETAMDYENSGEQVSIANARKAAGEYAEEEVGYDRTEEINGIEYYFFRTDSNKMILVDSHDIDNVFGAEENEDGSWNFDQ